MKHWVKNITSINTFPHSTGFIKKEKEEMSQKLTDNNISPSSLDRYTVLSIQMVTREAATRDRKQLERGKINILCREHGWSGG